MYELNGMAIGIDTSNGDVCVLRLATQVKVSEDSLAIAQFDAQLGSRTVRISLHWSKTQTMDDVIAVARDKASVKLGISLEPMEY